jgi:hypothetical protein
MDGDTLDIVGTKVYKFITMATANRNSLLKGLKGGIGKQVVIKTYANGKTVVSAYPDMSQIIPTEPQKEKRSKFKEAVAYAQSVLKVPLQRAAFEKDLPEGKSVYHAALSAYLKK